MMPEKNRFQFSNFREVFGELEKVHRVRRSKFQIIIIPALIFLLLLGGIIAYTETRDVWVIPFCVLLPFLLFAGLVWHLFSTRRDELRIYENGFTYKGGKNLQACLWSEIKFFYHRELNELEMTELKAGIFPLGSVEKKSGEVIAFDPGLPGTPEITERFELDKRKIKRKRSKVKNRDSV